jgi:effector-binding domain-containing protein
MTIVGEPTIAHRAEKPYMGIRVQVPMKGMFKVADQLRKELSAWFKQQHLEVAGPPFLRYHVIDMSGDMDIEVGFPVVTTLPDDTRVKAGVLPEGRYAYLIYVGHGLTGNKALLGWAIANGLAWDRWDDPKGDAFRSRCETYLTDPKIEPKKTKWEVELAIKLMDD